MIENQASSQTILAAVLASAPHKSLARVLPVLHQEAHHWSRMVELTEALPLLESGRAFDALCESFLQQEKSYAALRPRFEESFRAATDPAEQETFEAVYNGLTDICVALRDLRFNMIARHCENAPPQEPVFVAKNKEDIEAFFDMIEAKKKSA